jgi:hypothetical protein
LNPETIQRTREHFAALHARCIEEAKSGEVFVNDLPSYITWQEGLAADSLAGKNDGTFTFWQMATYIEIGVCVPFIK